jgi:hypothetical protein
MVDAVPSLNDHDSVADRPIAEVVERGGNVFAD